MQWSASLSSTRRGWQSRLPGTAYFESHARRMVRSRSLTPCKAYSAPHARQAAAASTAPCDDSPSTMAVTADSVQPDSERPTTARSFSRFRVHGHLAPPSSATYELAPERHWTFERVRSSTGGRLRSDSGKILLSSKGRAIFWFSAAYCALCFASSWRGRYADGPAS
jgi:hypothetical protein